MMLESTFTYPTYSLGWAGGGCKPRRRSHLQVELMCHSGLSEHGGLLALCGSACVLGALWLCGFEFPDPGLPLSILFAFPALACGFESACRSHFARMDSCGHEFPEHQRLQHWPLAYISRTSQIAHATHRLLPVLTAKAGWESSAIYAVTCLGVASLLYFCDRASLHRTSCGT